MKKKLFWTADPEVYTAPAYPRPGHALMNELRQLVALESGCDRDYLRLGALLGSSKATLGKWCTETTNPAVQAVFGLLERLPAEVQTAFLRRHCRIQPRLSHPALAHDPTTGELLRQLLRLSAGMTLVKGESPHVRSFLVHALGHDFAREDARNRTAAGVACHSPHVFVPVEGMFYLRPGMVGEELRRQARELWPRIVQTDTALVLLDGLWSRMTELHPEIMTLALTRHVIVADEFPRSAEIPSSSLQLRTLQVSGTPSTAIHVRMHGDYVS
jgi:hypothetical protein